MTAQIQESMVFYSTFAVNLALAALVIWGLIAFFPRRRVRGDTAASWLILAIWLGFLAAFFHTAVSDILGPVLVRFDLVSIQVWHHWLEPAIEMMWNAVAFLSVYLHFYARYKSISAADQPQWSPLLMGFYPDLSHWAVRIGQTMNALYRKR